MWLDAGGTLPMWARQSVSARRAAACSWVGFGPGFLVLALRPDGMMTQDVMGSLSSSGPRSITLRSLTASAPASPPFMYSTVQVMLLVVSSRTTAIWASQAPDKLVWPRGRFAAMPQGGAVGPAELQAARAAPAAPVALG